MKFILIFILFYFSVLEAKTYTFSGGQNNVAQMIASKILIRAYQRAGLKAKGLFLPLEEALIQSNEGITDGELARIKNINKLYPNLLIVPVSIISAEAVAFSTNSDIKIKKWSDLKGYDFTLVKGAKFIEIATKDMNPHFVSTIKEAFKALNSGKTEIIVIPKKAAIRLILKKEFNNIKPISPTLQKIKLYHFINKKNADLVPIITPILQEMKDSGEIMYMNNAFLRNITY